MRASPFAVIVLGGLSAVVGNANARLPIVDWSNVTLSGSFPTFTFANGTLGTVTLEYSANTESFGIDPLFAGIDSLLLGGNGDESLTISWTSPITSLDIFFWDVDSIPGASTEILTFTTQASLSGFSIHPTDVFDAVAGTLSGDGTNNDQSDPNNFSIIRFTDIGGFTSIEFDWEITGPHTGAVGIGNFVVPACAADITGPLALVPDGDVDSLDFLLLISQWGSPCGGSCEADFTGPGGLPDGNVDALDFLLLIAQWGSPGNCSGP